jgi:dTDP-glucose 4,6-dehydratase
MRQPRKIAVLGSGSFAGCWFVDYALSKGAEVIGINRSAEKQDFFLPYAKNPNRSRYTFHRLDLNRDNKAIIDLLLAEKPDCIVDFAGQGMVAPSWQWPEQWYETNIVAKVKIHNALKEQSFLETYVRASTPEVFGANDDDVLREDTAFNPSTPYAVAAAATDMSLIAFYRQYNFPVILTRFANFYGPGQQLYRIVPKAIICGLQGIRLPLHGGGRSVRAFIHGYDVAAGLYRSIEQGRLGESYHFTTDEFVEIRDLVAMVASELGLSFEDMVEIVPDRPGKDAKYIMTSERAKRELQWSPRYTLREGIAESIKWVRENLAEISKLPHEYIHLP